MALSRRTFFRRVGLGGAGVALVNRRGAELLAGAFQQPVDPEFIGIGNNENPRGPGDAVLEALRGRITHRVGRYPDNIAELTDTIAKKWGGRPENVLLATGSGAELIAGPERIQAQPNSWSTAARPSPRPSRRRPMS